MKKWLRKAAEGVASVLISTGQTIKAQLKTLTEARLRQQIYQTSEYDFTCDYTVSQAPIWERYLEGFKGKPGLKLLEIGCFQGRSSLWFLQNILTHPTATITCVDPFSRQGGEPRFDHNISVSGLFEKVTKIKGSSEKVLLTLYDEHFDIVYVDGSHVAVNVLMDAMLSWRLLKEGGLIIFDDYAWEPQRPPERRPKMAIDIFLSGLEHQMDVLHKAYQVIVRKKTRVDDGGNEG